MGSCAPDARLEELRLSQSREAWAEFLRQYSSLIFQVCQFSTSDADQAADCFLFACEQLSRNHFRRLLRFRPQGAASFPTWLRVVVRNLCLDWRRREFGRPRLLRSIARLPHLEVEVYRCRYERGLTLDETFLSLSPSFPGLTLQRLMDTEANVRESLSSRQFWLLNTRMVRTRGGLQGSAVGLAEDDTREHPVDPRPDQEAAVVRHEQEQRLRLALWLPAPERLLLRLRFEEELSLGQIARLTGLGDAQRVHRRIADILGTLRKTVS